MGFGMGGVSLGEGSGLHGGGSWVGAEVLDKVGGYWRAARNRKCPRPGSSLSHELLRILGVYRYTKDSTSGRCNSPL